MLNKMFFSKAVALSCASACWLLAQGADAAPAYNITDLGAGDAEAMNDSGQIALNRPNGAFLYSNGTLTALGTLGGSSSYATALNDDGQVVGYSWTSGASGTPREHAFLYSDGTISDLGTLGGDYSYAAGINDSGQVVGRSETSGGSYHAFLYGNGTMHDLGVLPGTSASGAVGINKSGVVAGWSDNPNGGTAQAFLYSNGTMNALDALGWSNTLATAINDSGQVVGGSDTTSGSYQPFLYTNGTITAIGALLPTLNRANSINNSGQAVGYFNYNSPATPIRAFLYRDGTVYDLNNLIPSGSGWALDYASGINNLGQIIGWGTNQYGYADSFLLTPVPEPATLALLGLGLAALALKRRRTGSALPRRDVQVNAAR